MDINKIQYKIDYTWVKTKTEKSRTYDLFSPAGRRLYFNNKAGKEITALRHYLNKNTFITYLTAPKMGGKGTCVKMLAEIIGEKYFEVISVGDIVRDADQEFQEKQKDSTLYKYVQNNYRGFISIDDAFDALIGRSAAKLLPTEFILTLIKRKIDTIGRKCIIMDGFPRKPDQVSYSLYFRDLINYRKDPDIFVIINLPISVIDARIKNRRVCPVCRTSRNLTLNPTSDVRYDDKKDEFYLMCDNPDCRSIRMLEKEGDHLGIDIIKERVEIDLSLADLARKMYGIPKIELYNSLEIDKAFDYVDKYETTSEKEFRLEKGKVVSKDKLLIVEDHGKKYYSLYPAPVVVQLIKQIVDVLNIM